MTRRRCEIATEAPYLGVHVAPACGKPATWASDDVARDGSTVWMCERALPRADDGGRRSGRRGDQVMTYEDDDRADFADAYARDAKNDNKRIYPEEMTDDERRNERVSHVRAVESLISELVSITRTITECRGVATPGLIEVTRRRLRAMERRLDRILELEGEA